MKRARLYADTISMVHMVLMALLLFGWLLPRPYYWLYFAALWLTIASQLAFKECVLTRFEFHYRRKLDPALVSPGYLNHHIHALVPGLLSDEFIAWISNIFLWTSAFVSLVLLYLYGLTWS